MKRKKKQVSVKCISHKGLAHDIGRTPRTNKKNQAKEKNGQRLE